MITAQLLHAARDCNNKSDSKLLQRTVLNVETPHQCVQFYLIGEKVPDPSPSEKEASLIGGCLLFWNNIFGGITG